MYSLFKLGSVDDLLGSRLLVKLEIFFASMSTSLTNREQLVLVSVSYIIVSFCKTDVLFVSNL